MSKKDFELVEVDELTKAIPNDPGEPVCESLDDHQAAAEAVKGIEGAKTDSTKTNKRIIPARENKERDHVQHRHNSSAIPYDGRRSFDGLRIVDVHCAKDHVDTKVASH